MTLSRRETSERLDAHALAPKRSLGQNFVVDPNTVRRIARIAGVGPGDRVIEIGPGLGALTRALLDTGAEVTAVEIDGGLAAVLRQDLGDRVRIVEGDARAVDWAELLGPPNQGPPWVLVANLPYNVATPLIADLLDDVPAISRMLVMVQKEVAERLAAKPGTGAYGAVSVKVAYWAEGEVAGKVPATVFLPRPNVDSALVAIRRRPVPAVAADVTPTELFGLVRTGFAQRRKMLRRSLDGLAPAAVLARAFAAAGVRPEARAEELDVVAWGELARALRAAKLEAATAPTPAPAVPADPDRDRPEEAP